jgi:hypothetical protein
MKDLAIRPGKMARDYVSGKRKSYFNPFSFFLIVMTFFILVNATFKGDLPDIPVDPKVLARIPTEQGKQSYIGTMKRLNNTAHFRDKYANVFGMTAVFLISLITWLFFYKKGYNYAEHLTGNLLFITFSNLVFAMVVFPLMKFARFPGAAWIMPLFGVLAQAIFLTWCLMGFLRLESIWQKVKAGLVSFLSLVAWVAFSIYAQAVYIVQGFDVMPFLKRWFNS